MHTRIPSAALAAALLAVAASPAIAQQRLGEAVALRTIGPAAVPDLVSVTLGSNEMAEASLERINGPRIVAELATAVTAGAQDRVGATSVATVANVNLLEGVVTAGRVIAIATAGAAGLDAGGSAFEGLRIRGVALPVGDVVPPNTRIDLPGVGYVVLNEQVRKKDEIVVTMIHLVEQGKGQKREWLVATARSGR